MYHTVCIYLYVVYYRSQSLSQLKVLDLSYNEDLKKVPSLVGEIKTLKELNLRRCGLDDLPQRLVQVYIIYWAFYYHSSVHTEYIICTFMRFVILISQIYRCVCRRIYTLYLNFCCTIADTYSGWNYCDKVKKNLFSKL